MSLTVARLLLSSSMEEFRPICRQDTGSPGIDYFAPEKSLSNQKCAQLAFISPIIWVTAVTIIRASVISLYIHVFPTRPLRIACYGAVPFNVLFQTATILADYLICRPIKSRWDSAIKGASCGDGKIARSLHRHCQLPPRRHCGGVAHAHIVAFANGCEQEGGADRHVWHGHRVRLLGP